MPADDQALTPTGEHAVMWPGVSLAVLAPVEAVWAVLEDGWLYATWVVGAASTSAVDHDWPQAGSRLHHSVGRGRRCTGFPARPLGR